MEEQLPVGTPFAPLKGAFVKINVKQSQSYSFRWFSSLLQSSHSDLFLICYIHLIKLFSMNYFFKKMKLHGQFNLSMPSKIKLSKQTSNGC